MSRDSEEPGPADTARRTYHPTKRSSSEAEADQKRIVKEKHDKDPAAKRKAMCHFCKMVMLQKTLSRHITHKHGGLALLHGCEFCDARFHREDTLKRHKHEQHGEGRSMTICIHCKRQVRLRSLNDHLKSRKCRSARTSLESEVTEKESLITVNERHFELSGRTGLNSSHDPLLACANFCVITWLIYDTLSYESDDWRHPLISIETSILKGLIAPDKVVQLWRMRGAAINSTRLQLSDLEDAEQMDGSQHDHLMMTIALLSAAEDCIFDKRSEHTSYLHAHHKAFRDQRQALCRLRGYLIAAHQRVWFEFGLIESTTDGTSFGKDREDTCLSHLLRRWRCPQQDFMRTLKDCWKNTRRHGRGEVDVQDDATTERRSCPYWRNRIISGSS